MKHPVTVVGGWLVAVVLATGVGMLAVSLLRDGFAAEPEAVAPAPVSTSDVASASATPTATRSSGGATLPGGSPSPRPTDPSSTAVASTPSALPRPSTAAPAPPSAAPPATPAPPAPTPAAPAGPAEPVTRSLASAGGTAIARCTGASAYLLSWSPAPGYKVDDHERGPGTAASVTFEPVEDDDTEVTLSVTCAGGVPVGAVTVTAED